MSSLLSEGHATLFSGVSLLSGFANTCDILSLLPGGCNFRNFTVIIVIFQAECDKQANQIVDQFLKKRQFKEKVCEIIDDFFVYENEPVERWITKHYKITVVSSFTKRMTENDNKRVKVVDQIVWHFEFFAVEETSWLTK